MKRSFFQAAVVSILLYGCTTWTLTKRLGKKPGDNYSKMLRAILNKLWRQHPTKHQLYGLLPPITKAIQVRRTRHAGHCWRSRDVLISDVLLWTPSYGRTKAGRPARTYILQLWEDTGCSRKDLPEAMNDRKEWSWICDDDDDDENGVNLGAIAMKECPAFPRAPVLLSLTIRLLSVISRTLIVGCSRCILQPQPTVQVCRFRGNEKQVSQ